MVNAWLAWPIGAAAFLGAWTLLDGTARALARAWRSWHHARRVTAETETPAQPPVPGPRNPNPHQGSRPAPGLSPADETTLAAIYQARAHATPGAVHASQIVADGLREKFPHLDDTTLGLITLDLFGYAHALAQGLHPMVALAATLDGLGLAAEELTRLSRTDVTP